VLQKGFTMPRNGFGNHKRLVISTDAGPWGFGATLAIDGIVQHLFCGKVHPWNEERFPRSMGSHEGQQVWESLRLQIALRVWKHIWQRSRCSIEVTADNTGGLSIPLNLSSTSPYGNETAKEVALDIADGLYFPHSVTRVPGSKR